MRATQPDVAERCDAARLQSESHACGPLCTDEKFRYAVMRLLAQRAAGSSCSGRKRARARHRRTHTAVVCRSQPTRRAPQHHFQPPLAFVSALPNTPGTRTCPQTHALADVCLRWCHRHLSPKKRRRDNSAPRLHGATPDGSRHQRLGYPQQPNRKGSRRDLGLTPACSRSVRSLALRKRL